jgi:hypothetical protein
MTIAAGLVCSDGIILCADTEYTQGDSKFNRTKVFQAASNKLIVTGSNAAEYIKVGYDKLSEKLKSSDPADPLTARAMVEEVISQMYELHIIPFQSVEPNLGVELIVAIRCANNQLALIKTVNSTAAIQEHYAVTGYGWHLFEYWSTYFLYKMKLDMEIAAHIAIFILREVKMAGYQCGGSTFISKMPANPATADKKGYIFKEKHVLADFPQSAIDVLFAAMDLGQTDSYYESKIEEFKASVKELRGYIKRQSQLKSGVYTATSNVAIMRSEDLKEKD